MEWGNFTRPEYNDHINTEHPFVIGEAGTTAYYIKWQQESKWQVTWWDGVIGTADINNLVESANAQSGLGKHTLSY